MKGRMLDWEDKTQLQTKHPSSLLKAMLALLTVRVSLGYMYKYLQEQQKGPKAGISQSLRAKERTQMEPPKVATSH